MKDPEQMTDDELLAELIDAEPAIADLFRPEQPKRRRIVLTVNGRSPSQLYRDAGRILGNAKRKP